MFPINRPLLLAFFCICVTSVQAQNEIPALSEKSPVKATEIIKLRNVSASVMMHWLRTADPNLVISSVAGSVASDKPFIAPYAPRSKASYPKAPAAIVLPKEIKELTIIEAQNALLISGSAAAIEQGKTLIRELDKPLRQFEIECYMVALDQAALDAAGFQFQKTGQDGKFQQATVKPSFHALLNSWVQNRQGVIFSAPRLVTFEGATAEINSYQQMSNLQISVADGQKSVVTYDAKLHKAVEAPYIANQWSVSALPTAHNNGTVTVELGIEHKQLLAFRKSLPVGTSYGLPDETNSHVLQNLDDFKGILSFKDGRDSVALTGFAPATIATRLQNQQHLLQDTQIVVFVSMREVRRSEPPVPGT